MADTIDRGESAATFRAKANTGIAGIEALSAGVATKADAAPTAPDAGLSERLTTAEATLDRVEAQVTLSFDAVLFVGASKTYFTYKPDLLEALFDAQYPGHGLSFYLEATPGDNSTDILGKIEGILDGYDGISNLLVWLEAGGNDITASRPLSSNPASGVLLGDNLDAIIAAIHARGHTVLLNEVTYRTYDTNFSGEDDGSKPYNDQVIYPRMVTHSLPFLRVSDSRPIMDQYEYVRLNHAALTKSDGLHYTTFGEVMLRKYFADTIGKLLFEKRVALPAAEIPEDQVPDTGYSGKRIIFNLGSGQFFESYQDGLGDFLNNYHLDNSTKNSWEFEPSNLVYDDDTTAPYSLSIDAANVPNGLSTSGISSGNDSLAFSDFVTSTGIYCGFGNASFGVIIEGLTDGGEYLLQATSASGNDQSRTTLFSVDGGTAVEIDATGSQLAEIEFVASGTTATLLVSAGADGFGYLNGFSITERA